MRKNERAKRTYFTAERSTMTAERLFTLGLKSDKDIVAKINPNDRGDITADELDNIREMAARQISVCSIASRYGASRDAVFAALEIEVPVCLQPAEKPHEKKTFKPNEAQVKEIVFAYNSGTSSRDLATLYATERIQIRKVLKANNVVLRDERRDHLPRKPRLTLTDENTIARLYQNGIHNPDEIVRMMNGCVSRNQVVYYLKHIHFF